MTRKTKAQIAAEAAEDLQLRVSRDAGRDYFAICPEATLVVVARHAATIFPSNKQYQIAYLQGYIEARQQYDAYKRGE